MLNNRQYDAIVIGASAGGISVLSTLVESLPPHFSIPIIIATHLPADKISVLDKILGTKCSLTVKEAFDKEYINEGYVYLAPPNYHLLVEKDFYFSLSSEDPVLYSRPSIDVLFETAADAYEEKLLGIILTGANSDGALGLKTILMKGGSGIIQTPQEAEAECMPRAAIKQCPAARIATVQEICLYLKSLDSFEVTEG